MAVIKTAKPQTLLDLAQAQMFTEVKARVKKDLVSVAVEEFTAKVNAEIDEKLAEYSTLAVLHLADMLSMKEEFIIYISNGKDDKVQVFPAK